jgi:urea carboxylase
VRFYQVTETELDQQRDAFREGRAQVRIEHTEFDFAEYNRFLADNADDIADFRLRQHSAFINEVAHWQAQESAAVEAAVNGVQPVENLAPPPGERVSADLNGNVWKILVEPGQYVEAGQPLIVVEAMKMELAVNAPCSGTVLKIGCQQGRPVGPGDALLWIDKDGIGQE